MSNTPTAAAEAIPTMKTTTTATTRSHPSRYNSHHSLLCVVVACALCLGVGTVLGFAGMALVYHAECHQRLETVQQAAVARARTDVREELDECRFHTQALRTQVDHHMTARWKEVQAITESSEHQIVNLQATHAAQVQMLQEEVQQLRQTLADAVKQAGTATTVAPPPTEPASTSCQVSQPSCCDDLSNLQTALQQRFLAQTKLKYGLLSHLDEERITLEVELTLDVGGALHTIVVRLDHLDQRPMTTATFLYLLGAGLYTGVTLQAVTVASGDGAGTPTILHANLTLPHTHLREAAAARWVAHGFSPNKPLLWVPEHEHTQIFAPCPRYGIGLDWYGTGGGDWFVVLAPGASVQPRPGGGPPCLGHITQGHEWLRPDTHATLAHAQIQTTVESSQ